MESNPGAPHTVNIPNFLSPNILILEFILINWNPILVTGAPNTVNEPKLLIYNYLESNPGAPHTVNQPNILIYS